MADKLVISRAGIKDAVILTSLSITTFHDTFGAQNRKEDMDIYLATEMNLIKLTKELSDNNNHFVLAWLNDVPVGYAKMRPNKEPGMQWNNPMELERIYVLHAYHSKKAGAALMQYCIDYALGNRHDVLWLGVWEHNYRAVKFYTQWGFEICGAHPFVLGNDPQTDLVMKKML